MGEETSAQCYTDGCEAQMCAEWKKTTATTTPATNKEWKTNIRWQQRQQQQCDDDAEHMYV